MKKLTIILLLTTLTLSACNFNLYNKSAIEGGGGGGSSNNKKNNFDQYKKVSNVTGTEGVFTDKLLITWSEMQGASSYIVERVNLNTRIKPNRTTLLNINTNKEWVNKWQIVAETENTKYEDKQSDKLDKTTYYAYRVRAKSIIAKKESLSPSDPVLCAFLTAPNDMDVSKGKYEDKITITFTQTPGATAYELYMNTENTFTETTKKITTISNFSNKTVASYEYKLSETDSNRGKNLYFSIKSISSRNNPEKTDYSESKTGYTFVPGAPQMPDAKASTGEDPKIIRISFIRPDGDDGVSYTILRSIGGGADTVLAERNSEKKEILLNEDTNEYYYEDTADANTLYTYSVYGKSDRGLGQASVLNSYLLSPIKAVTLEADKDENHFGYNLVITPPLGYEDNNDWVYVIENRYNDNKTETITYEHNAFLPFYTMPKEEAQTGEIREVTVVVKNTRTGKNTQSVKTTVAGVPDVPSSFLGTRNVYDDTIGAVRECTGACDGYKYGPDKQYCSCIGVYPIILRWAVSPDAVSYRIEKYSSPNFESSKKISELNTTDVRYNDKVIAIGKKYSYRLYAEDALGRHKSDTDAKKGYLEVKDSYGAITAKQFASEFERHISKPWEFQDEHGDYRNGGSKGGIWSLIRKEGTGSLGSADARDSFLGGQVSYSAKVSGLGGALTFTYSRGYGEKEYIHIATAEEEQNVVAAENESQEEVNRIWRNLRTPQGYNSTVGLDGNGDYTPWNDQTFYLGGWYGNNEINMSSIVTQNKKLAGKFKVTMRYNTLDGKVVKVYDDNCSPQSYKIVN